MLTPESNTTIILRLRRPLQPELPPVEAAYVDGEWVCEDEYIRTWLEHEIKVAHWHESYVFYPEWTASLEAVEVLKAEIIYENFDDDGDEFTVY